MPYLNIEIKARTAHPERIRNYLKHAGVFHGLDEQTDTYFTVTNGRLKLREGNIENNLIFYNRADHPGPKSSQFNLVKVPDSSGLKEVLTLACGIRVVVTKKREIYYIGNVKFHIDEVPGLGIFVEIEAGNILANLTADQLQEQCEFYMKEFGIDNADLVNVSYSDMLLAAVD